jgi:phage tail-like protein
MNKSTDITLKRGVIGDSGFSDWIKQVSAGTARLQRKNLILELHDEIGNKTSSWTLGNCRVSSFKPLPSLDKKAGTIAIETLVIQSESLKLNP